MISRILRSATLAAGLAVGMAAHAVLPQCTTITIDPATTLPDGTVGTSYSQTFAASGSAATPYGYQITGGLPTGAGLSINASTGELAGTPAHTGALLLTVTATDTNGCSGGRTYALAIAQGDQTISFSSTAPAAATVAGATYDAAAVATSGLPVTLTIDASAGTVCSIAGSTVSFIGVGTCVIDANQAGDADYNAAAQVQQSFAVGKGDQTISFTSTAPAGATVGGATYDVTATGGASGNAVTFTIDATAGTVCSIAGSTVSFIGIGTCVIDANQAGDANYNAATQAQQSFAVGKSAQTINFTSSAPGSATVGGAPYDVTATGGGSGNPVTFTIDASAASVCSIAGATVSFIGVGTCVIDADQAGDANYNAATQAQQSFAVGKGAQAINFTSSAPAGAVVGGTTYEVTATGGASANPVTFTIDATASSICSIAGSTVSFSAVGTCVIDANQAGDANYNAATQAQQSFAVGKGTQTINFTSSPPVTPTVGGATYTVTATGGASGNPVTFTIDAVAAGVCSIAGATVSFTGVGTCVIDANQAGDANLNAATQVQQSFAVGKGTQTINFTSTAPINAHVNDPAYTVTATGGASGNAVTFTIDAAAAAVCSIVGSTVSLNAGGTCIIDANQAGDTNYNAATQVQQSFAVAKLDQTITFSSTAPANAKVAGATYSVSASGGASGNAVTFSSGSAACSVAGSTVSFVHAGTCIVNADQAGNAQYNAAAQVQQSFVVAKGDQTINVSSAAPTFGSATAAAAPHTYSATASATSGLTVTVTTSGACSNVSNLVTFGPGAGMCTINADQPGDADWNPAPQVQQSTTVEIPASAVADSHNATGNVAIAAGTGVMSNDSGTSIAIKSYGATTGGEQTSIGTATATAQGGSVTLNAAGTYNYGPPANFTGTDSFKYIIGNDLAATSTGTVTLTISDRIIVVASGASGNCKPATPCALSTADALASPSGKDLIFVQSGSYTNPNAAIALNANQVLTGNFVSLTQAISDATITLATESVAPTIAANTTPTLSNNASAITLGGGNLVEYFSITNTAGSAILGNVAGAGTSSIHDITVTNGANAGNGVNLSANLGTVNFSNLVVATSSGGAFAATGGGTVNVTTGSTPNTLASTTGTALNVANTTIGASGLTFRSITAGTAAGSAGDGIVLDTTGTNGGLTVTGNGVAGSGGTIQHKTGADLSTASGIGIYLKNTSNVSLSWMQLNDFDNFAIYGTGVNNLAIDRMVVSGVNGTNASDDEGSVAFGYTTVADTSAGLTGSVTVTNSNFGGGAVEDTFRVRNGSGSLNRITMANDTFACLNSTGDALKFETVNGGVVNATIQNSTFTSAAGDLFNFLVNGTATDDLVFTGNTLTNNNPLIATGGGGVTVSGGDLGGSLTFTIDNNSFRDAVGTGVLIVKSTGAGTYSGSFSNNSIGVAAVANSGSLEGDGLKVQNAGQGAVTIHIVGNQIRQYNLYGIEMLTGGGATAQSGALNATISGNTIGNPGNNPAVDIDKNGVHLNAGTVPGDTYSVCLALGGAGALANNITGSGAPAPVSGGGQIDFRLRQRQSTTVRLPGYAGAATNTAQVITYIQGLNGGTPTGLASVNSPPGGGFVGGAACP